MSNPVKKNISGSVTLSDTVIIPSSRRPDGSLRKPIKVRPGFVAAEDQVSFASSRVLNNVNTVPGSSRARGITSIGPSRETTTLANQAQESLELTPAQRKNKARNDKKKAAREAAELAALLDSSDGAVSVPTTNEMIHGVVGAVSQMKLEEERKDEGSIQKKIKALQKKLRQIDDIKKSEKDGKSLDDAQVEKVNQEKKIQEQVEALGGLLNKE